LGATVATVLSSLPWLVNLSHHKVWVFTTAGVLIALAFIQTYAVSRRLGDEAVDCTSGNPGACYRASRFSKVVLWLAVVIYGVGFFVAFLLGPILNHLDAG
jgi:hypothetical protein